MLIEHNKNSFLLIEHFGNHIEEARIIECDGFEDDKENGVCRIVQGNDQAMIFRDFLFDHSHLAPQKIDDEKQVKVNSFTGTLHFATFKSERLN